MPQKKPPNDSGLFASKATMKIIPKRANDTMFFTATTSFDFEEKVVTDAEKVENMLHTFEIGRHGCKYMGQPKRFPLLTHAYCTYRRGFGDKEAGDLLLNRQAAETAKKAAGRGGAGPDVDYGGGSSYVDAFCRSVSTEDMRRAKPPASSGGESTIPLGGKQLVTRSSAQAAHCGRREGVLANTSWEPHGNLGMSASAPDFFRSRYQLEHSHSAAGLADPAREPRRRGRARRGPGGKSAMPDGLQDLLQELGTSGKLSGSAPSVAIPPITHLGAGH